MARSSSAAGRGGRSAGPQSTSPVRLRSALAFALCATRSEPHASLGLNFLTCKPRKMRSPVSEGGRRMSDFSLVLLSAIRGHQRASQGSELQASPPRCTAGELYKALRRGSDGACHPAPAPQASCALVGAYAPQRGGPGIKPPMWGPERQSQVQQKTHES